MFDAPFVANAIDNSAENAIDRRRFLRSAAVAGLGVAGASYLPSLDGEAEATHRGPSDSAILNFALNLEYLEAEFYVRAVTGQGLADRLTTGRGRRGGVSGGRKVNFKSKLIRQYAREIAEDEKAHVAFLRKALGRSAVARPRIDLNRSFTAAARAAGLIGGNQRFDAFANENNFLLSAYIFEDVGVTAYKGAAPLIDNKTFLEAAAGLLAVEAYHASNIRTVLLSKGLAAPSVAISNARDSLDGPSDLDQGVRRGGRRNRRANVVPADRNGLAFSRTAGQVLNILYLNPNRTRSGGFFPGGVNGPINTSDR